MRLGGRTSRGGPFPLTRRALRNQHAARPEIRLTSASAKSTPAGRFHRSRTAAHLRLRGHAVASPCNACGGSPPPARRAQCFPRGPQGRFPVHLRLRGERSSGLVHGAWSSGPPPPARRARALRHPRSDRQRSTSACAESARRDGLPRGPRPAHLRLRGEHDDTHYTLPGGIGSPPPARRAPQPHGGPQTVRRFTSACAESTHRSSACCRRTSAHLRLRGEHGPSRHQDIVQVGPPPPARRAHGGAPVSQAYSRSTSAGAERARRTRCVPSIVAAHLRLRGEHLDEGIPMLYRDGPSPPARRAREHPAAGCVRRRPISARAETTSESPGGSELVRFTSARAEITAMWSSQLRPGPVHLRSRGEHRCEPTMRGPPLGPPLFAWRGHLRLEDRLGQLDDRFTSACAERPSTPSASSRSPTVHLRLRGEVSRYTGRTASSAGSPPPARRGRPRRPGQGQPRRFTSACAERSSTAWARCRQTAVHLRLRGEVYSSRPTPVPRWGSPPPARRGPFATCGVRSALPISDSRNAGHAPA